MSALNTVQKDPFWKLLLFCMLAFLQAGCGGDNGRATVHGTVSLEGIPLESGLIQFLPAADSSGLAAGASIENGRYTIKQRGPLPGSYQVHITASRETGRMIEAPTIGPGAKKGVMVEETMQYIPDRYNAHSELTIEINPGANQHDFDLAP